MESKPLVSILMNCYNGEKYLKEAIDSIYAQTYQNWEIIFIDNCSTDSSAKIAQSYSEGRLKYYKTNQNIPLGGARNWGLQFVQGSFLAFLDVDDMWMSNKLEIQIAKMLEDRTWLSFSSVERINELGKQIRVDFIGENEHLLCKQLFKYSINMQTVVIDLTKVSVDFDTTLSYAPDYKLFMSVIAQSNNHATGIKQVLAKYRVHSNSLSYKLIDIKYSEKIKILDELKLKYNTQITRCDKEYARAILLCEEHKAEGFLMNGDYIEGAKSYYKMRTLDNLYYLKSFLLIVPIVNKLFYKLLLYKRKKRLKAL